MPENTYHWPAEWSAQEAIWLAWPHNRETWPGKYEPVPPAFAKFVRAVADSVSVRMLAEKRIASEAERFLDGIANVELVDIETNDCWTRDYGPTFIHQTGKPNQVVGIDWKYNSWGGKYPPWDLDAVAAKKMLTQCGIERIESELCLEGGAIETDGCGRVMLTPDCVLTDSRNPGWTKEQVEAELTRLLGANEFIWLTGGGLAGDDTDGHIDQLARFIDAENIVAAVTDDRDDPNHQPLEANFQQLSERPVHVHRLPIPPARYISDQRVPESYCNFLFTPDSIIMPTFNAKTDDAARRLLGELAADRTVIPIDASDLSWGLGAFHCMSQQQVASQMRFAS